MTRLERAIRIIETTPGRIAHAVFERAGIDERIVRLAGMSLLCGFWRRK